jgi:hypothetical protein
MCDKRCAHEVSGSPNMSTESANGTISRDTDMKNERRKRERETTNERKALNMVDND